MLLYVHDRTQSRSPGTWQPMRALLGSGLVTWHLTINEGSSLGSGLVTWYLIINESSSLGRFFFSHSHFLVLCLGLEPVNSGMSVVVLYLGLDPQKIPLPPYLSADVLSERVLLWQPHNRFPECGFPDFSRRHSLTDNFLFPWLLQSFHKVFPERWLQSLCWIRIIGGGARDHLFPAF